MKPYTHTIASLTAVACLGGCAPSPSYSPPPERRAAERCPMGETWICEDRYPSRLERENEMPKVCYCESLHRVR
jgi:hypothetical protein